MSSEFHQNCSYLDFIALPNLHIKVACLCVLIQRRFQAIQRIVHRRQQKSRKAPSKKSTILQSKELSFFVDFTKFGGGDVPPPNEKSPQRLVTTPQVYKTTFLFSFASSVCKLKYSYDKRKSTFYCPISQKQKQNASFLGQGQLI